MVLKHNHSLHNSEVKVSSLFKGEVLAPTHWVSLREMCPPNKFWHSCELRENKLSQPPHVRGDQKFLGHF